MHNASPLGTLDGRLSGHLAAALADWLVKAEGSERPARKGDSFWHMAASDFEFAQAALEAIGVFPRHEQPNGKASNAFIVDAEKMPDFLARNCASDKVPYLIEAFVRVACGYGNLPTARDWFECPKEWKAAMKYLALAGYAQQDSGRYRWTELIAPQMRAAHFWDEQQQSHGRLEEVERKAECDAAWRTMPDTLRARIRTSSIDIVDLVKVLARSWKDGRWHDPSENENARIAETIFLARALMERAKEPK